MSLVSNMDSALAGSADGWSVGNTWCLTAQYLVREPGNTCCRRAAHSAGGNGPTSRPVGGGLGVSSGRRLLYALAMVARP